METKDQATTPSPDVERSSSTSQPPPRWQRRQAQRQQYLTESLATCIGSSPSSPISTSYDLRSDISSEKKRNSTLTSTSLRKPGSSSTLRHPESLSSTFGLNTSSQVNSDCHPADSPSRANSSTARTSLSDSWRTCSDPEVDNTQHGNSVMADEARDKMLAASDRRRRQNLPLLNTSSLQASRAPSSNSLVPQTAQSGNFEAPNKAKKHSPRGPTEREDKLELHKFLGTDPAELDSNGEVIEPKSAFDWGSDDEEDKKSKVSFLPRIARKYKQSKEHKEAEKKGKDGESRDGKAVAGMGPAGSGGIMKRQEVVQGSGSSAKTTTPRITSQNFAARSPSLAKMFEDTMHERGYGSASPSTTAPAQVDRSSGGSSAYTASPSARKTIEHTTHGEEESGDPAARSFWSHFKQHASITDLRNRTGISGNAFAQEEARQRRTTAQDLVFDDSTGTIITACYSDSAPSKTSYGDKIVEKLRSSPVSPPGQPQSCRQSPASTASANFPTMSPSIFPEHRAMYAQSTSPTSGLSTDVTRPAPRGMPHGPEDPDWDDAVKWARKKLKETEAREAKEARDVEKEAKKEEKRLKKLRAGKDAIQRQSVHGLVPKKPLDDITEDEFETVGEVAMATAYATPTAGSYGLGAFFTQMSGTDQEQAQQVHDIGHRLDNHASLHKLSDPGAAVNEQLEHSQAQHDATLRMLTGGVSIPEDTVNAGEDKFTRPDSFTLPVGLGITDEQTNLDERAKDNHTKAQTSMEEFRAIEEAEERATAVYSQPVARAPFLGRFTDPAAPHMRPMTTIREFDGEGSESSKTGSSTRVNYSPHESMTTKTWSTESSIEERQQSNYPAAGIKVKQDIRNLRSGHRLSKEEDSKSIDTIDTDAIPEPLDIPKTRTKRHSPMSANDADIHQRSPNIPIIHVSQSSLHLQPSESNSFIPRRNSGFNRMIQETSRLQAGRIGSHPALRDYTGETDTESEYSYYHGHDSPRNSMPKPARVDSGIDFGEQASMAGESERHDIDQRELTTAKGTSTVQKTSQAGPQARRLIATLMAPEDIEAANASGIDLQSLRRELSLTPLQMPTGSNAPKHPNHPFTWNHEKIMCFGVHNVQDMQPQLPAIPENQLVDMGDMSPSAFKFSSTKGKLAGVKVCIVCGMCCCRFANLVNTIRFLKSDDPAADTVRVKTEEQLDNLRTYHPNGVEEYDIFLSCLQCERKICPGCSIKCMEQVCQAIICVDCAPGTGVCPVHNEEQE